MSTRKSMEEELSKRIEEREETSKKRKGDAEKSKENKAPKKTKGKKDRSIEMEIDQEENTVTPQVINNAVKTAVDNLLRIRNMNPPQSMQPQVNHPAPPPTQPQVNHSASPSRQPEVNHSAPLHMQLQVNHLAPPLMQPQVNHSAALPTQPQVNHSAPPPTQLQVNHSAPPPTQPQVNHSAPAPMQPQLNHSAPSPTQPQLNYSAPPPTQPQVNHSAPPPTQPQVHHSTPTPPMQPFQLNPPPPKPMLNQLAAMQPSRVNLLFPQMQPSQVNPPQQEQNMPLPRIGHYHKSLHPQSFDSFDYEPQIGQYSSSSCYDNQTELASCSVPIRESLETVDSSWCSENYNSMNCSSGYYQESDEENCDSHSCKRCCPILKEELRLLKQDVKKMKKSLKKLGSTSAACQSSEFMGNFERSNEEVTLVDGHTKDAVKKTVETFSNATEAIKKVITMVFTIDELTSCSVIGQKKNTKTNIHRTGLDESRRSFLEDLISQQFNMSIKEAREKIRQRMKILCRNYSDIQ